MAGLISKPLVPMSTIGQKMFDRMYALGVSQKEFAELAGVSNTYLNSVMHGKYPLTDSLRDKIETAFDLLEEEHGGKTDDEFTPPRNDWFTRIQLQKKQEEAKPITPEMLADICDVQHGRKEYIDYSKYTISEVDNNKMLRDLFIKVASSAEIGSDIFALYGKAVLRVLEGGDD